MKAILMTTAGGPDVLQLREIEKPELPSPHHLRVKLAAAGVNPIDTQGAYQASVLPRQAARHTRLRWRGYRRRDRQCSDSF